MSLKEIERIRAGIFAHLPRSGNFYSSSSPPIQRKTSSAHGARLPISGDIHSQSETHTLALSHLPSRTRILGCHH
jgi:hypothetical protein